MSNVVATAVNIATPTATVKAIGVNVASVESGGALNAIFNIPKASDSTLGGVKIPLDGVIEIDSDGNISIDENAITMDIGATATIDNNVGTPTVTVTPSKSNGKTTLAISFRNLKGVKGDKGDPFEYSDFSTTQLDQLKSDIVADVLDALPDGNTEVY